MKCEFCRFAPPVNADGFQDECPMFEKHGITWKDGREGCTVSYNHLLAQEQEYYDQLAEYATDWGLDHDFENHGWDMDMTIKHCKHMIGFDRHVPPKVYHRHGKVFYRAYRNYWGNGKREKPDFEYMCSNTFGYMEKVVSDEGMITYCLTDKGLEWLGRKISIVIRKPK